MLPVWTNAKKFPETMSLCGRPGHITSECRLGNGKGVFWLGIVSTVSPLCELNCDSKYLNFDVTVVNRNNSCSSSTYGLPHLLVVAVWSQGAGAR